MGLAEGTGKGGMGSGTLIPVIPENPGGFIRDPFSKVRSSCDFAQDERVGVGGAGKKFILRVDEEWGAARRDFRSNRKDDGLMCFGLLGVTYQAEFK